MVVTVIKKIYYKNLYYKNKLRVFKQSLLGASIGKNTIAYGRFTVANPSNLIIGNQSTINEGVHLNCRDQITIGDRVHLSTNAQLHTGKLIVDKFPRYHDQAPIIIENDVWIASGVTILAGVVIGEKSVVAAGSIVTKSIPPNSLVMGVPARVVKTI